MRPLVPRPSPAVRGATAKILHIEDNPENRMLVRALLEGEGYAIVEAEDGLAGVEAAVREQPDLVLLDINLPGLDGYEVGAVLKSFPALATTPVVALTAYAMEGDRQRTLVAGCDGYIPKPIDPDRFAEQVEEFLRGKRERVEEPEAGPFLRELNQRLVYRLVDQVGQLRRRAAEAQSLVEAGRLLTSTLDLPEVLQRLAEMVREWLTTDCIVRIWLDETGRSDELRLHAQVGSTETPAPLRIDVSAGARLVGEVFHQRASVMVEDLAADPRVENRDRIQSEGLVSFLGVPILLEQRPVGILSVVTRERRAFSVEEVSLVEALARSAAVAIGNARLYAETRQRLRQTETLLRVSRAVGATLDVAEVARRTTRELVRTLGADLGGAWRLGPQRDRLVPLAGYHIPKDLPPRLGAISAEAGTGLAAALRELREPICARDGRVDPPLDQLLLSLTPGRSAMIVPMRVQDETIGAFAVLWTRELHEFQPEELRLVKGIVQQAAMAIENARLLEAEREARERVAVSERRQEALVALSRELAAEIEPARLLSRIAEEARRLMGMHAAMVLLLEDDRLVVRGLAGIEAAASAAGPLDLMARLTGVVVRERRPLILEDLAGDPAWTGTRIVRDLGYRSLLAVPITLKDQTLGALTLLHCEARPFAVEETEFLQALATEAALAIDNARLFAAQREEAEVAAGLLRLAQAIEGVEHLDDVLDTVVRTTAQLMGVTQCGLFLLDQADETLVPSAVFGLSPEQRAVYETLRGPARLPAVVRALATQEPVVARADTPDLDLPPRLAEALDVRSLLVIPLVSGGRVMGMMAAHSSGVARTFTPKEIALARGIAAHAAVAIDKARLFRETQARLREARELSRLARMLTESLDAADVGQRIVESSLQLLGGKFSVLRLLQPDGTLKLIASRGEPDLQGRLLAVVPVGVAVEGRAASEGAPVWSPDVVAEHGDRLPEALRRHLADLGPRAYLAAPLRLKREIIGVVGICDETGRRFSAAEGTLLQTFADQAAIALENSRLYGDLRAALQAVEESQQRIVQGERLRALGEMAGGVAHDFNNVLAIIVGRAEVLLSVTDDPELKRQLNVIVKVALDAAQTVKRIQEFTRMRRARPFQQVHIHQLLEEVVDVTRSRWKDEAQSKGLRYEVVVEANPTPPVMGDPSEIREALTNIVFNALDAMPDGGTITLRTGVEGPRVVCTISDTGIGMSDDVRQRIFDPFFTTKGERGTGLGLSVVYGIMTRHSGEVDVQSRPGAGSTFVLRFPVAGSAAPAAPPRLPAPARRSAVRGRVLVIDDEPEVAEVLRDVLAGDGHQVVVCHDGEAGLAAFGKDRFDLVITDLGMPGVSGWEVARQVKSSRPGTPVAMVTGWGDRIDTVEAAARGVELVLSKPFKREQVRELVGTALSAAPRSDGAPA